MSEIGVIAVMAQAYPNIDFPIAVGDAYWIRDHELKNALDKGLSKMAETTEELALVAALAPSGYRVMPEVIVDNYDGENFNLSNGWVRFEGDFLAGDIISIHGIKWDPVMPLTDPPEFEPIEWGFEHVVAANGDGIVTAADVVASFIAQININGEAVGNRCRVFSSLVVAGGTSPGFSMHRVNTIHVSGDLKYVGFPDWPNTENQYEDKSVPPVPPAQQAPTPPPVQQAPPVDEACDEH